MSDLTKVINIIVFWLETLTFCCFLIYGYDYTVKRKQCKEVNTKLDSIINKQDSIYLTLKNSTYLLTKVDTINN